MMLSGFLPDGFLQDNTDGRGCPTYSLSTIPDGMILLHAGHIEVILLDNCYNPVGMP